MLQINLKYTRWYDHTPSPPQVKPISRTTPPPFKGTHTAALGAGADFVMLGGMFAGHDQSGGKTIERDGKKYKLFYGMSSATAMKKYQGGVKDYRYSCHIQ